MILHRFARHIEGTGDLLAGHAAANELGHLHLRGGQHLQQALVAVGLQALLHAGADQLQAHLEGRVLNLGKFLLHFGQVAGDQLLMLLTGRRSLAVAECGQGVTEFVDEPVILLYA
ncbi:hypothetical protein D3C86_1584150 [compost metagenome]